MHMHTIHDAMPMMTVAVSFVHAAAAVAVADAHNNGSRHCPESVLLRSYRY